ncbi:alpha/beta hydrolase [Metabacillus sp. Hm71]|uniref:alpha/beta hydrolase n=1 Tax=Metabacillus sp. Hm71 TaxID=3450743 RepID=UPI003F41EF12
MKHIFIEGKNKNAPTLLLLHGTGGNERDLLPIAEMIDHDASVLGVRGNVLENGMPRFFRRLAEGVFDKEDLIFRTKELNEFLSEMAEQYQFNRNNVVAIGYSNGANIAASLMYHYKNALNGAILLHAMVPRRGIEVPDLANTPVFIGAGTNDPLIPQAETKELANVLRQANAAVTEHWGNAGHQLTREEIEKAKEWYDQHFGTNK